MKFDQYFITGPSGALKFKQDASLTYRGDALTVYSGYDTVLDQFFVGEYSTATYTITVEADSNSKETVTLAVVARPNEASVSIISRTSIDNQILVLSGEVDASIFKLKATTTVAFATARVTVYVVYGETFTPLSVPTARDTTPIQPVADISSSNVIFQPLVSTTGFQSPNFVVNGSGVISAASLTLTGAISTTGTISTTGAVSTGNLTVTGALTQSTGQVQLSSSTTGSINNVTIGNATPAAATFTEATVEATPTAPNLRRHTSRTTTQANPRFFAAKNRCHTR